jgi:PST family polysaccharide transporter
VSPEPDETGDPTPDEPGDLTPRSLTGTVMRGAGIAIVGFVLTQLLTLGFYIALARLATPADFGQFAAASIVVTIGLLFTESGMLAALIHRRDRVDEAASTAVVSTAIGGFMLSLTALALSPLIGSFFGSDRIGDLAAALSGLLLLRSLQVVPEALLQRNFSFLRRMIVEPLQATAFGVAAVIACSDGMGPWGLVIGFYAAAVTDVLLSWPLVRWRPRISQVSFAMWQELISYGRHVIAGNAAHRVGDQIPKVVLGRFVGDASLGQFRFSDRIASTPVMALIAAASYVLFPAFARISGESQRFGAAFLRSLRWFSVLAMPMALILIPLGVPLAVTVFGDVWRDAGYAAMALSGFALGTSLISLQSEAFKATGNPHLLPRVHLLSAVATVAGVAVLLPFDLVGVAGGVSIGLLVGASYGMVKAVEVAEVGGGEAWRQMWPPLLASLVMAGALVPLEFNVLHAADKPTVEALALIALEAVIGAVIFIGVLRIFVPDILSEARQLAATIRHPGSQAAPDKPVTPAG